MHRQNNDIRALGYIVYKSELKMDQRLKHKQQQKKILRENTGEKIP